MRQDQHQNTPGTVTITADDERRWLMEQHDQRNFLVAYEHERRRRRAGPASRRSETLGERMAHLRGDLGPDPSPYARRYYAFTGTLGPSLAPRPKGC